MTNDELGNIRTRVVEIVDARLASGRPTLLSGVGIELKDDLKRLKELTGLGLADFVTTNLADRYTLVRHASRGNVLLVMPVGANVPPEDAKSDEIDKKRISIKRELWEAFTTTPAPGTTRFFSPKDMRFLDSSDAKAPAGYVKIAPELLPASGSRWHAPQVTLNAVGWLEKHKIDPTPFVATKPVTEPHAQSPGRSVLEAVLSALEPAQLRATELSLDVVAALLRKRL